MTKEEHRYRLKGLDNFACLFCQSKNISNLRPDYCTLTFAGPVMQFLYDCDDCGKTSGDGIIGKKVNE